MIAKICQMAKKKRKESKGFTLMELIIVVAIIAILLALLVPNLTKFLGSAKTTSRDANAKTAYTSASAWAADMATQNIALTKGTLQINKGKSPVVVTGVPVNQAQANLLLTYFNADEIKSATIVVSVNDAAAIEKVTYKEGSITTTYPK